jgi:hypothetical protein
MDHEIRARYISPMARPVGQFRKSRSEVYQLLRELAGLGCCYATTGWLSRRMKRSERQIERYIASLKKDGLILIRTSKPMRDLKAKVFYRRRSIRISKHLGAVERGTKFSFKQITPDEPEQEQAPSDNGDAAYKRTLAALAQIEEDKRRLAEERAFSASLDPDAFDHEAVLRELQAELAEQGIIMELNTNGNVSP